MNDTHNSNENRQWQADLHDAGLDFVIDESLGPVLRALSGLNERAVCLCSGTGSLPYVNWIRDGLSMNGRLIIHLAPECTNLDSVVQQQLDADIRVASHYQEVSSFCADIAVHRLDLIVVDIAAGGQDTLEHWVPLLKDNAMLIAIGSKDVMQLIIDHCKTELFFADIGARGSAAMLTKKGVQHRLVRRSGRRRTRV